MIIQAERMLAKWLVACYEMRDDKRAFADAVRNYNALRGVIKGLKWTLNQTDESPLA